MRQVLLQVKDSRAISIPGESTKPARVWTLCDKVSLPFHPQHGQNAFLEDFAHDWSWIEGQKRHEGSSVRAFRYFSRVTDPPVWVLLEFEN